jgi:hypothetical protein
MLDQSCSIEMQLGATHVPPICCSISSSPNRLRQNHLVQAYVATQFQSCQAPTSLSICLPKVCHLSACSQSCMRGLVDCGAQSFVPSQAGYAPHHNMCVALIRIMNLAFLVPSSHL